MSKTKVRAKTRKRNCVRLQEWRGKAKSLGIAGKLLYLTIEQSCVIEDYINSQGWSVCSPRAAVKAFERNLALAQAEAAKLNDEQVEESLNLGAVQSDLLSDLS